MAREYASRTLREIVRVVAGRSIGMLLILIIAIGSVLIASVLAPKWYQSTAEIMMARPERVADPSADAGSLRDRVQLFVVAQREILLSDRVIASALMRLEGRAETPTKTELDEFIRTNTERLRKVCERIRVESPGGLETTFTQVTTVTVEWPQERLEAGGRADPAKAAQKAHDMNEYLVDAYLERNRELVTKRTKELVASLEDQARRARQDVIAVRQKRQTFLEQVGHDAALLAAIRNRGTGTESGSAALATAFQAEVDQLKATVADRQRLKEIVDQELRRANTADVVVPDAVLTANSAVTSIRDTILELKSQLNTLQAEFTDRHPKVETTKAELVGALRDLRMELEKESTRLGQTISALEAKMVAYMKTATQSRVDVGKLARKVAEYEVVQRDVEDAESLSKKVQDELFTAVAAQKRAESDEPLITLLDAPTSPDPNHPIRPILWLNVLIAAVTGLVLAFVYAFLADHFDHTIKSSDDAERYVGLPVLGSVPKLGREIIRNE